MSSALAARVYPFPSVSLDVLAHPGTLEKPKAISSMQICSATIAT